MSYAVVKFVDEAQSDEEIVSEVPLSWLVKDNKFCKWHPEKYAAVSIAKNVSPQDNWQEYPVQLEHICDSLLEAKSKAKGGALEKVGRGYRKVKPLDYFSPAEEEDRLKEKKKEILLKKSFPISSKTKNCFEDFMQDINNPKPDAELSPLVDIDVEVVEDINLSLPTGTKLLYEESRQHEIDGGINICGASNSTGSLSSTSVITSSSAVTPLGHESIKILGQLDVICQLITQVKLDVEEIKQKMHDLVPNKMVEKANEPLPVELPMKSLDELDTLNDYVSGSEEQKLNFISYIKKIGGDGAKDFTTRIMRTIFTNGLAEACSLTGRKNNFPIGNYYLLKLIFGVVHNKTCTQKEFETNLSEWLRHAKQRRLREK